MSLHRQYREYLVPLGIKTVRLQGDWAKTERVKGTLFREATRNLPLNTNADIIVCGAGPAGTVTAIAAQRKRQPHEVPWSEAKTAIDKASAFCSDTDTKIQSDSRG